MTTVQREHEHHARRLRLEAGHGRPVHVDTAAALRLLGLRGQVHPRDAYAFTYRDQAAADAWQAATLDHHGVPSLGTAAVDGAVVGVYDLRPALARLAGLPPAAVATPPGLPDGWVPTVRLGGRRRAT